MEVSFINQNTIDIYGNMNLQLRLYDLPLISNVLGTIFLLNIITRVSKQRAKID